MYKISTLSKISRRKALMVAAGLIASCPGWAQSLPVKPVRLVVPFPAGTSPDVVARLWGKRMSESLGQPLIIDNKPGAASIIGVQAVLTAPADGYTLLYAVANTISINPYIYKKLPYKTEDLVPIGRLLSVPLILVVASNSPFNSLSDLVRYSKANPGKLNYSSYGVGTANHVAMARFLTSAGLSMTHVPYKDGGINDLVGGRVQVSLEPSTTALGFIKSGKLRALGVSSPKELAALPNVRPVSETFPDFAGDSWHGVFASKGTPTATLRKLEVSAQQVLSNPEFRQSLTDLGLVPATDTVDDFRQFLEEDKRAWSKVVRDYDIKAD